MSDTKQTTTEATARPLSLSLVESLQHDALIMRQESYYTLAGRMFDAADEVALLEAIAEAANNFNEVQKTQPQGVAKYADAWMALTDALSALADYRKGKG